MAEQLDVKQTSLMPGLCRHRPGHSLGGKIKSHEMKNGKTTLGFRIHKIWQMLKHFTGVLS